MGAESMGERVSFRHFANVCYYVIMRLRNGNPAVTSRARSAALERGGGGWWITSVSSINRVAR